MDQHQQELRQAAARAFVQSLDQLQETLQTSDEQSIPVEHSQPDRAESRSFQFDLNSLEQAVADIEQFMEQQQRR